MNNNMILEIIESKIYLKSNILWTDGMASQDRWRLANLVITNNKIAQKSIKGHITSTHMENTPILATPTFCLRKIGTKNA